MVDSPSASTAAIRIRLFAALRERAGWSETDWPIATPTPVFGTTNCNALTPRKLWQALQLPGPIDSVRVAINQQFADADTTLCAGDELAFLPPISGG